EDGVRDLTVTGVQTCALPIFAAHSSARIPPIDPPSTAAHRSIPSWSATTVSARTWSRIVSRGKRLPHTRPSGSGDDGPVDPWQRSEERRVGKEGRSRWVL